MIGFDTRGRRRGGSKISWAEVASGLQEKEEQKDTKNTQREEREGRVWQGKKEKTWVKNKAPAGKSSQNTGT